MNKLKSAIVGCGAIHKNHGDALMDSDFSELTLVVDLKEDRAKAAAENYKCRYATDFKRILDDESIDVVHICTPHYLHAPMAIEALKAGKHVFTEKPMSITTSDALQMIKTAKDCGRHLGVCFQNRLNNTSVKAKEILDSGSLGSILGMKGFVTWFRDSDYYTKSGWRGSFKTEGGGVLINQSIHTIDLMQWLGGGIDSLRANVDTRVLNDVIEVEDTADATFYFKNGATGIFYATNCYTTNSPVEVEIHCERGFLHLVNEELYLTKDGESTMLATDKIGNNKYKSYWGLSHSKLIEEFYRSIPSGDKVSYVTGEEGIKTIEILDAIYKASALRKKMKL